MEGERGWGASAEGIFEVSLVAFADISMLIRGVDVCITGIQTC